MRKESNIATGALCRLRRRLFASGVGLAAATSVGCSDMLTVDNPQDILVEDLATAEAVPVVLRGVTGDFAWTYSRAITALGYFANELIHTGSSTGWRELERGVAHREGEAGEVFNRVARTAWAARNAAELFREVLPDAESSVELARAKVYSGFTYLLMADNFCVVTLYGGAPMQPQEVYQGAEQHFTDALAVAAAAGEEEVRHQALAGRARTRLMLGDFAGAREDASQIPTGFRLQAIYSERDDREHNHVPTQTTARLRKEGGVHPRFYEDPRFAADPRTQFINLGPTMVGEDRIRQFVEQTKYPARSSPANISSWQEVRLIQAEAELELGNTASAIQLIDEVRAAAELPAYSGPATPAAVRAQLMYERSAELFLEAKHLVDLRRTNHPLLGGREACFPLSYEEFESNPNVR